MNQKSGIIDLDIIATDRDSHIDSQGGYISQNSYSIDHDLSITNEDTHVDSDLDSDNM